MKGSIEEVKDAWKFTRMRQGNTAEKWAETWAGVARRGQPRRLGKQVVVVTNNQRNVKSKNKQKTAL